MARYKPHHNIWNSDEVLIIRDELKRDVYDGNTIATRIKIQPIIGTVDPYTEEVVLTGDPTWLNASGIVSQINERDALLGISGRVKTGDVSISYHYDSISSILNIREIELIEISSPVISGLYHVNAYHQHTFAGIVLYVKFALTQDSHV